MLVKGILDESVSWQELSEVEKQYHREIGAGKLNTLTRFLYAQKLVKSQYQADILKGIKILEDILGKDSIDVDVDEVYLSLALGFGRLGDYKNGLFYIRLSSISCAGRDELEAELLDRLHWNGWIGVGVVAGTILITSILLTFIIKRSRK